MTSQRRGRALAVVATVLILTFVAVGCGRRVDGVDLVGTNSGSPQAPAATLSPTASPAAEASTEPAEASSGPSASPDPGSYAGSSPTASAVPLVAPDLTAIQQLIDDIDAALGADATADNDEGSSQ
ncbi:MAG: hypothetical protein V4515_07350 [Chloroflexota bacterium]